MAVGCPPGQRYFPAIAAPPASFSMATMARTIRHYFRSLLRVCWQALNSVPYSCLKTPLRERHMSDLLRNCFFAAAFVLATLPSRSTLADVLTDLKTAYCYTLYDSRRSNSKLP